MSRRPRRSCDRDLLAGSTSVAAGMVGLIVGVVISGWGTVNHEFLTIRIVAIVLASVLAFEIPVALAWELADRLRQRRKRR